MRRRGARGVYGIPFHCVDAGPGGKAAAETRQLELLEREEIDLVVLAAIHAILSPDFVARRPHRIINVHHSFLPAFVARVRIIRLFGGV